MIPSKEASDMIAMEKWFIKNSQQIEQELKKLKESNVPNWTNSSITLVIILTGLYNLYQYSQTGNKHNLITAVLAITFALGQVIEYRDLAPSTVRQKLSKSHIDHSLFLFGSKSEIKSAKDVITLKNRQIESLKTKTPVVSNIIDDDIIQLQAIRKHVMENKYKINDAVISNISEAWRSSKPNDNSGNPPANTSIQSTVNNRRK